MAAPCDLRALEAPATRLRNGPRSAGLDVLPYPPLCVPLPSSCNAHTSVTCPRWPTGEGWAALKFKLTSVTFMRAGEQRCYITRTHTHTHLWKTGTNKMCSFTDVPCKHHWVIQGCDWCSVYLLGVMSFPIALRPVSRPLAMWGKVGVVFVCEEMIREWGLSSIF